MESKGIKVVAKTKEELETAVNTVYSLVSVEDQNHEEMLIKERNSRK